MQRRIAVTGMGVVSPIGNSTKAFWQNLLAGQCGIGPITRLDASRLKVRIAAEVKDFDPAQHGIDAGDAKRMDLFSLYALAAAQEAMAQSGLAGQVEAQRFGVYLGSGVGGINTTTAQTERVLARGPDRASPLMIPMMIANMAAGNAAIRFNAQGPCMAVVTACATSTHAIGEACRAIRHGYADAMLAGGSEAAVNLMAIAGFTSCMALSDSNDPAAASLPFDARRRGFVMGEGAGVVVLEAYELAQRRGAPILGEIVGYGSTCDAYHMTAPQPDGQGAARAMRQALAEAGYGGEALYINAHGTGTPLNDKTETLSIKSALGLEAAQRTPISSIKGAVGHMLGAAGAVECIATLLALQEGILPPTLHLQQPDPECDLDYVPQQARPYQAGLGLSVSLGFGGHNGALAIRRAV